MLLLLHLQELFLKLTWKDSINGTFTVYGHKLYTPFTEATSTWNNWAGGGGGTAGTDYDTNIEFTQDFVSGVAIDAARTYDITSLVQFWHANPADNKGMIVVPSSGAGGNRRYYSNKAGINPADVTQVKIRFSLPPPEGSE